MSQSTAQLTAQIARASAALQQMDDLGLTELTDMHPTLNTRRSVFVVLLRCSMLLLYPKIPSLTQQEPKVYGNVNTLALSRSSAALEA